MGCVSIIALMYLCKWKTELPTSQSGERPLMIQADLGLWRKWLKETSLRLSKQPMCARANAFLLKLMRYLPK
jgi:hypothetical protein